MYKKLTFYLFLFFIVLLLSNCNLFINFVDSFSEMPPSEPVPDTSPHHIVLKCDEVPVSGEGEYHIQIGLQVVDYKGNPVPDSLLVYVQVSSLAQIYMVNNTEDDYGSETYITTDNSGSATICIFDTSARTLIVTVTTNGDLYPGTNPSEENLPGINEPLEINLNGSDV